MGRFAISVVMIMIALPWCAGCTSDSSGGGAVATQVAPEAKYSRPEESFGEFADVAAAQTSSGRPIRVPRESLGHGLAKVVVRDNSGGASIPKGRRPVDLHFGEDLMVSEVPFETPELAQAFIDSIAAGELEARYVKRVSIAGHEGLAWNPYHDEPKKNSDGSWTGGLTIGEAKVIWAEDDMVYAITSRSVAWPELMRVAVSLN